MASQKTDKSEKPIHQLFLFSNIEYWCSDIGIGYKMDITDISADILLAFISIGFADIGHWLLANPPQI